MKQIKKNSLGAIKAIPELKSVTIVNGMRTVSDQMKINAGGTNVSKSKHSPR